MGLLWQAGEEVERRTLQESEDIIKNEHFLRRQERMRSNL